MSKTIERHQGAVRFTKPKPQPPSSSDAVIFTKPGLDCVDDDWDAIIETVCSFSQLQDDWDGGHAVAPEAELIFMAVRLAGQLKKSSNPAPGRVVAGVNGTISFEFGDDPFMEIEVTSPAEAEVYENGKLVQIVAADEDI